MVMIEAAACGTPVVAFGCGSVPEVVEHGVSGFIVRDEIEAAEAVDKLHTLPRAGVRHAFERRFTSRHMAERYVGLYAALAGRAQAGSVMPALSRREHWLEDRERLRSRADTRLQA